MSASVASRPMGSGRVVWRTWHLAYSCLAAGPEQTGPSAIVAAESPVALQLIGGHAALGIHLVHAGLRAVQHTRSVREDDRFQPHQAGQPLDFDMSAGSTQPGMMFTRPWTFSGKADSAK